MLRVFLAALVLTPIATSAQPVPGGFDPTYADIRTLREALDERRITSEALVRHYLERIARFDKTGPALHAVIALNPEALAEARHADALLDEAHRRARARARSEAESAGRARALLGIPFLAKDNYDTAGLATTGGAAVLESPVPSRNAHVIQRLLDHGAILLGKTNMSELAESFGRLGYSSAGGLTLNPWNPARDPSGSSSGSGAAVAAGFAPFALGTDTGGSIRGPAGVAGLVGLRPTWGLVGRAGIIPLSVSADTPGALTRTVADQAIVLDAIAGEDPADAATAGRPRPAQSYAAALALAAVQPVLSGLRIGAIGNFRGAHPDVDAAERAALEALTGAGAEIVPITLPASFDHLWERILDPDIEAEFKPAFERYLTTRPPGGPRTLAEVIRLDQSPAIRDSATPVNPGRLEALRKADSGALDASPAYVRHLTETVPELRATLRRIAAEHGVTVFAFSTMSCPAGVRFRGVDASYHCGTGDPYAPSYLAAISGFPEITVPTGRSSERVPLGMSFLGLPFEEPRLLAIAAAFERLMPRLPRPPLATEAGDKPPGPTAAVLSPVGSPPSAAALAEWRRPRP